MSLKDLQQDYKIFNNANQKHKGFVVDNEDPKKMGRIKCIVPNILEADNNDDLPWCYPLASRNNFNNYQQTIMIPDIDDEVEITFYNDDYYVPYYSGQISNPDYVSDVFKEDYPHTFGTVFPVNEAGTEIGFFRVNRVKEVIDIKLGTNYLSFDLKNKQTNCEIDGDYFVHVKGNYSVVVDEDYSLETKKNTLLKADDSTVIEAANDLTEKSTNHTIQTETLKSTSTETTIAATNDSKIISQNTMTVLAQTSLDVGSTTVTIQDNTGVTSSVYTAASLLSKSGASSIMYAAAALKATSPLWDTSAVAAQTHTHAGIFPGPSTTMPGAN